jgi:hypothetical protein
MTNRKLTIELQTIGRGLDEIDAKEHAAALGLERRFAEDQEAIEKLLKSTEEAKASGRWRNSRLNVFEVLGYCRLERAHSSVLAWLLDPAEAHGLGDEFLRQFMRRAVGTEPPSTAEVTVSPEFECGDNRFDIHVTGDGWRLVVENKIDDSPWAGQCAKYQAYCDGWKKRGQKAWLVYITPHTRRPSRTIRHWVPYSDIRRLLESLTPCASATPLIEHLCEHIFVDLEV